MQIYIKTESLIAEKHKVSSPPGNGDLHFARRSLLQREACSNLRSKFQLKTETRLTPQCIAFNQSLHNNECSP